MGILDTAHRVLRRQVLLSGGRSSFHVLHGHRIHSYELSGQGNGPPLVLVHGVGASAHSFIQMFRALRKRWSRVYALDLAGHGFSTLEPGQPAADVREHYEVLKAYLDQVVRVPATLVGNSLGGALVLKAAIERPEKTTGLCLLSPAGAPMSQEGLAWVRAGFGATNRKEAMTTLRRMLHKPTPGTWLVANEFARTFSSPHVQAVLHAESVHDRIEPHHVASLKMPVAFVWGASERLLPADGLAWFQSHLPSHATVELFAHSAHLPMLEEPARVVATLDTLRTPRRAAA